MAHGPRHPAAETVTVMLVSAHDWFASALQAVLEPEGFHFTRVRSARVALRDVPQVSPDMVIIDEGLPDMDVGDLAASLGAGVLKPSVPVLVYSPNFWQEQEQAAAMRAGAWDIIKEPVRSDLVVAKLRRLLDIKMLIEAAEEGSLSDVSTGLLNLAGMMRMLRVLGGAARRYGGALSCAVVGPTRPPQAETLDAMRRHAAELCSGNLRESDVCGWVDDAELGIVAYGTDAAGVTTLVRRLNETAAAETISIGLTPLSAGIVELTDRFDSRDDAEGRYVAPMVGRIVSLSGIAAAQAAYREACEAGGGIRIADASSTS